MTPTEMVNEVVRLVEAGELEDAWRVRHGLFQTGGLTKLPVKQILRLINAREGSPEFQELCDKLDRLTDRLLS